MSAHIGSPRPPAWLAAVFEGAGAELWWHVETGRAGAEVWDAPRAAGWIDEVWPGTSAAVLSDIDANSVGFGRENAPQDLGSADGRTDLRQNPSGARGGSDRTGPLEPYARRAALAAWREAWWPASHTAGIAPLDPRVLAAERLLALAGLDGAADDDDAVRRAAQHLSEQIRAAGSFDAHALDPGDAERLAPLVPGGAHGDPRRRVLDAVAEIADDHGVELPRVAARTRADYALAASGSAVGAALLAGSDPVDPGAVPQGVLDPFGRIEWRVTATMTIDVTAPAAPLFDGVMPDPIELRAHICGADIALERSGDVWSGSGPAPAGILAAPPEHRAVRLRATGFAPIDGVDPDHLRRIAHGL